jgi:hypothetical protein
MCICEYIIVCYELEDSEMSHSDNPSTVNSKAGIYRESNVNALKHTLINALITLIDIVFCS